VLITQFDIIILTVSHDNDHIKSKVSCDFFLLDLVLFSANKKNLGKGFCRDVLWPLLCICKVGQMGQATSKGNVAKMKDPSDMATLRKHVCELVGSCSCVN